MSASMAEGIAEVLAEHELAIDYAEYFACTCGTIQSTVNGTHPEHVAEVLAANGYGKLEDAFSYGWREGKGHPTPVNLETGELFHDEAVQPNFNPYRRSDGYGKVGPTRFVLSVREAELLKLKGPCSNAQCPLHYAHSGPCDRRPE